MSDIQTSVLAENLYHAWVRSYYPGQTGHWQLLTPAAREAWRAVALEVLAREGKLVGARALERARLRQVKRLEERLARIEVTPWRDL